jgi:hypothetical protein
MLVLMGYRIPRNDSDNDRMKYAVVILMLFKPWADTNHLLLSLQK